MSTAATDEIVGDRPTQLAAVPGAGESATRQDVDVVRAVVVAQAAGDVPVLPAHVEPVIVEPPADGERRVVAVGEGAILALQDPAFDPASARYSVDGQDLMVALASGGIVVLGGFFGAFDVPPALSIAGGPSMSAKALLEVAETGTVVDQVAPAAAEETADTETGDAAAPARTTSGASFASYEPGTIDDGLPPLGRDAVDDAVGADGVAADLPQAVADAPLPALLDVLVMPMPDTAAPVVQVNQAVAARVIDVVVGYTPPWMPAAPDGSGGTTVNGLPAAFVTLDRSREVTLRLDGAESELRNVLGAFKINADGTLSDVRVVFGDTADDGHAGGTTVSLGTFAKGEVFGMFLLKDGAALNDPALLKGGRFEIRDASGEPVNLNSYLYDADNPLVLVRVNARGKVVAELEGQLIFSTDPSEATAAENPLNESGLAHVIHGYDPFSGRVTVGFDDGTRNSAGGRTFDDVRVSIEYGVAIETRVVVEFGALLNFSVTDPDSEQLSGAVVKLDPRWIFDGDMLILAGSMGTGSWVIPGTSIVAQMLGTEIRFSGLDTIENYERAINQIRFTTVSQEQGLGGERLINTSITDAAGNQSTLATTVLTVVDNRVDLNKLPGYDGTFTVVDEGGQSVLGTDGRDVIYGGDGDETLIGGAGNDVLVGGDGRDTLIGGPGNDELTGGAGADLFVANALNENRNTILDFNIAEGDRLRLEDLLTDPAFDPTAPNASDWLRFVAGGVEGRDAYVSVMVDLDGAGSRYSAVEIFRLLGIDDASTLTIENATTYQRFFEDVPAEDAVEGEGEAAPPAAAAAVAPPEPLVVEPPHASDGATV